MNDMSSVIVPKSDQINADDLIGGSMTITIREVQIKGGQEQPVSMYFNGSDKAYRPCKSMSRVLVAAWGPDANKYIGRSITLYRDPTVKWGGMDVGGIRISHLTHIDNAMTMALTATKGSRKPYTVKPLVEAPATTQGRQTPEQWTEAHIAALKGAGSVQDLEALRTKGAKALTKLKTERPDLCAKVIAADPASGPDLQDAGPVDFAESPTDAEADILAHLARKTTVIDVNSLIASRLHELDEDGQQRVRDAAAIKLAELKA